MLKKLWRNMKQLPDIRNEVRPFFETVKNMLIENVKAGRQPHPPIHVFATLTLYAQKQLEQPPMIVLVPKWQGPGERERVFRDFVKFLNKYGESAILCGAGRGLYEGFDKEVEYVFAAMYMPGFEPWTLAQLYAVVDKEVIFDTQFCSSDYNVSFFELPGLWPEGVGPV
jgi:hypothetical protein